MGALVTQSNPTQRHKIYATFIWVPVHSELSYNSISFFFLNSTGNWNIGSRPLKKGNELDIVDGLDVICIIKGGVSSSAFS